MNSTVNGRQLYCVVKDKYGNSVKSNTVTVTMGNAAKITTQPEDTMAANGATFKVTVGATGDGLTYAWYYKNAGASSFSKSSLTKATYSTTMNSTVNGRQLYCVVKDQYGNSVQTDTVTLSMGNTVKITTQPKDTMAANGATFKVTVGATGDGLTYAWYYKNAGASSFSKSSLTKATYSTTMNSTVDGRQLYCVVKDQYGNSVQTDTVTLSMKSGPLTITAQPQNVYANYGDRVSFTVKATGGTVPYTYRWQYRNNSRDWTNISQADWATGADTHTLSFNVDGNEFTHGYQYRCIIIDAEETQVTSDAVRVIRPFTITTQPRNAFVRMEDTAVFSVGVAGGKAPYTYSWETFYKPRTPGDWVPALASKFPGMSGSDTSQLKVVIDERHFEREYRFRCVITDADGNKVISNEVVPELNTKPRLLITSQPQNVTADVGDEVSFNVGVGGGTYPYSLQWQYSCYGSGWYNLSGATGYKYSFTVTDEREFDDEYCYRCVVTDADGESTTSDVVRVLKPFVITSQPKDAVCSAVGNTVTFSVKVTGGLAPYTYQWSYRDGTSYAWHYPSEAELAAGAVSGDKTATLSYKVSEGAVEDQVRWRCFITDATGNRVETDVAYVIAPLTITTQPKSQTGKDGDTLSYTVAVAGGAGGYTYKWYYKMQSGQWIASTTNSATYNFQVNAVTVLQKYAFYCVITDADGNTATTDTVTFTPA